MIYFLVLLFCTIVIVLSWFCNLPTLVSNSASFVFFSNSGMINSPDTTTKHIQVGIINRLTKYVATENKTSKMVKYIFINNILSNNDTLSRRIIKWV